MKDLSELQSRSQCRSAFIFNTRVDYPRGGILEVPVAVPDLRSYWQRASNSGHHAIMPACWSGRIVCKEVASAGGVYVAVLVRRSIVLIRRSIVRMVPEARCHGRTITPLASIFPAV